MISKYQKCPCWECLKFDRREWRDVLVCVAGAVVVIGILLIALGVTP